MATTSGAEIVQVMVTLQIMSNLDSELKRASASWDPIDKAVAAAMKVEYRRTIIEPVESSSYMPGDRPSVLRMPWNFFPAISVQCSEARVSAEGLRMDLSEAFAVPFAVEAIVPSDTFPSDDDYERLFQSGVVDRRAKRTGDAIVQCLLRDRTLGGVSVDQELNVRVQQTPPFEIEGNKINEHGESCLFSLARIDAQTDVYAALPGVETVSALLPVGLGLGT